MELFNNLRDKIKNYIDLNIKLLKLSIIEWTSAIFGYFIYLIVVMFVLLPTLLFLGFFLAEVFASWTDSKILGYLITSLLYVVALFILIANRKRMVRSFAGRFIQLMTEQSDEKDKTAS